MTDARDTKPAPRVGSPDDPADMEHGQHLSSGVVDPDSVVETEIEPRSFGRLNAGREVSTESTRPTKKKTPRRQRSPVRVIAGLAALLLGAAALPALLYLEAPASAQVLGDNYPVNAGARDLSDISAHNSPMLVQNPTDPANLAAAGRIDSPRYSCGVHISFDGGASWRQLPLPVPQGEQPRCFAPEVAFGADGTLYVLFVTLKGLGNVPNAVWLVASEDGGFSVSEPGEAILGPLSFQVRLTADPVIPDRLYLTWLEADEVGVFRFGDAGNPIRFTVSEDGGKSWDDPVTVTPASRERVLAPSLSVGPDGELFIVYLDIGEDRLDYDGAHGGQGGPAYGGMFELVMARSENRGRTWDHVTIDDGVVPVDRFIVFLPPAPSLAIDPARGMLYVVFHDSRLGDPDAWLWSSSDAGATWSEPVRVNDTREADGTSQLLPKVAVAPDGRVDVVYYDRRADPEDIMNEVSFQSSFDGGESFEPRVLLTDTAFDSRIGLRGETGLPDLGSRIALLSTEERAFAIWTDTRAGTTASLKQDLVRAVVGFSDRPDAPMWARDGLLYGGIGLGGLGSILLLAGLIGTKPEGRPDGDAEAETEVAPEAEGRGNEGAEARRGDAAPG